MHSSKSNSSLIKRCPAVRSSIHPSSYGSIVLLFDLGRLSSFLILYTVGRTPWRGDQPVARPLPTHRITQTWNKCTQTSMPWVGFESTVPPFERAKRIHALDRAAAVIGNTNTRSQDLKKISVRLYLGCNNVCRQISPDGRDGKLQIGNQWSWTNNLGRGNLLASWDSNRRLDKFQVGVLHSDMLFLWK
jgi:hypothetical protein